MLATLVTAQANKSENKNISNEPNKIETIDSLIKVTPFVIRFEEIDRIKITNPNNSLIRIYDNKWVLIIDTKDSIDQRLKSGSYYIASDKKIKKVSI